VYFTSIAHFRTESGSFITRHLGHLNPFAPLAGYFNTEHQQEDFGSPRTMYAELARMSKDDTVRTSIYPVLRALAELPNIWRFVWMWFAVEALFGGNQELTYKIAHRVSLFLGRTADEARHLFKSTKSSYAWRSKAVHGLNIGKLKPEEGDALLDAMETIVWRSLRNIFADEHLTEIFNSAEREPYLDDLAYGPRADANPLLPPAQTVPAVISSSPRIVGIVPATHHTRSFSSGSAPGLTAELLPRPRQSA
jgi:hypothetical protein